MTPAHNLAIVTETPEAPYTPESSSQLERDRQQLQQEQQSLTPLPHLPILREQIINLEGRAAFMSESNCDSDMLAIKASLSDAKRALGEALDRSARYTRLGNDIAQITTRLEVAQQRERRQLAGEADARLGQAQAEFKAAALQAAKLYRAMLIANHKSHAVAGASTLNLQNLEGFNVPWLAVDRGQVFSLGQQMGMGKLHWEGN